MTIDSSHPLSLAMLRACQEARLWIGATSPNPPVGAVALDKNDHILAVAAHHGVTHDHAEVALLKLCEANNLMGELHTLCITLEPCNHQGLTPPCTDAIIKAGVCHRVVIGVEDPNPYVKGGGIARLREAGIEVIENVEREACRRLIHAFAYTMTSQKPFVTVKRAFSFNHSMIPPAGHKTFTAPSSLVLAHRLRKKADAIIVGSGTILADYPLLTVRHSQDYPDKKRFWPSLIDVNAYLPPI